MGFAALALARASSQDSLRRLHRYNGRPTLVTLVTFLRFNDLTGEADVSTRLNVCSYQRGNAGLVSGPFFSLNIIVDLFFENFERQRSIFEHSVVKFTLVELRSQLFLSTGPQFLNL